METKITVKSKRSQTIPFLTQGITRGRRPNNGYRTVGGRNGTFVQLSSFGRADVIVEAELPDGLQEISLGKDIRRFYEKERLTKELRDKIVAAAPGTIDIVTDERGRASISDEALNSWLSSVEV